MHALVNMRLMCDQVASKGGYHDGICTGRGSRYNHWRSEDDRMGFLLSSRSMFNNSRHIHFTGQSTFNHYGNNIYNSAQRTESLDEGMLIRL